MKEHFPYLFWAYNIIWILIAGYLGVIFARQRSLRRQIEELRSRLVAIGDRRSDDRRALPSSGQGDVLEGEIID